jgi:hypothetical protein
MKKAFIPAISNTFLLAVLNLNGWKQNRSLTDRQLKAGKLPIAWLIAVRRLQHGS